MSVFQLGDRWRSTSCVVLLLLLVSAAEHAHAARAAVSAIARSRKAHGLAPVEGSAHTTVAPMTLGIAILLLADVLAGVALILIIAR